MVASACDAPTSALATAWTLLQPLLFSLIGAEVDTDKLDTNVLGLAVVVIMLGEANILDWRY